MEELQVVEASTTTMETHRLETLSLLFLTQQIILLIHPISSSNCSKF